MSLAAELHTCVSCPEHEYVRGLTTKVSRSPGSMFHHGGLLRRCWT